MILFRRIAIAMLVLAAQLVWAQDFNQFKAAGPPVKTDDVAKAIRVGRNDSHIFSAAKRATFETLSDSNTVTSDFEGLNATSDTVAAKRFVYESHSGSVNASPVRSNSEAAQIPFSVLLEIDGDSATEMDGVIRQTSFAPACGIPGCMDPACGLPSPACGLPGDPACGLPSVIGEPTCGAGGGCDSCGGCGQIKCGALCTRNCPQCCGVGTHYSRVYGDALYLRSRTAEVAYAVDADGPIAAGTVPIQIGNIGIVDPDYELGFRAGWNVALDTVSSIDVRYTLFESHTEDETSSVSPFVVRSMVSHPSTANAAADVLSSLASLDVDFDAIDVSYRHLWKCYDLFAANYVIGARYATLEQQFKADFVKNVEETVSTDIDFDGAGLRFGLETERYSCRNRLHVYANGYASFLAGRYRAHYFQGNNFDGVEVDTEWEAGRVVPIVDLEAGIGWSGMDGKLQLSAGYMVSAWFNGVRTQDFINAVQTNSYLDLGNSIWFDGLQARLSYCF